MPVSQTPRIDEMSIKYMNKKVMLKIVENKTKLVLHMRKQHNT
jgi:hypothetical protein